VPPHGVAFYRVSEGIPGSEVVVFEDCAHAPIYENVDDFNRRTLAFLQRHSG
jgi:pimeloyl-ACP methyl ester carboxylesterase